tara:strand:+ start:110 stop:394 length:285 start_codon:yes stop_codon:yes gene_type:complete
MSNFRRGKRITPREPIYTPRLQKNDIDVSRLIVSYLTKYKWKSVAIPIIIAIGLKLSPLSGGYINLAIGLLVAFSMWTIFSEAAGIYLTFNNTS